MKTKLLLAILALVTFVGYGTVLISGITGLNPVGVAACIFTGIFMLSSGMQHAGIALFANSPDIEEIFELY